MTTALTVKKHECIYEETIQEHGLILAKLTEKSKYKEQSIMEIKDELKIINQKIDSLSGDINKIIQASEKTDSALEKRVSNLETQIDTYKEFFKTMKEDQEKRNTRQIAIFGLMVTAIGIIVGAVIKFI